MVETPAPQISRPCPRSFCFHLLIPRCSSSHCRKGGRVCGVKRYRSEAATGRHCEPSCACPSPRLGSLSGELWIACVECAARVVEPRTAGPADGWRLVERAPDALEVKLRPSESASWVPWVVELGEPGRLSVVDRKSRLDDVAVSLLVVEMASGDACEAGGAGGAWAPLKCSPRQSFCRMDWLNAEVKR